MSLPIRKIQETDAQAFMMLQKRAVSETDFLLKFADEFNDSWAFHHNRIEEVLKSKNQMIFVAEGAEGELVGFLLAMGKPLRKIEHTIYIVMGLLRSYQGQGVAD